VSLLSLSCGVQGMTDDYIAILHRGKRWRLRQAIATSISVFTFLLAISAAGYAIWQFSAIYHAERKICNASVCLDDLERRIIESEGKLSHLKLKLYRWEKSQRKEVTSEGKGDAS